MISPVIEGSVLGPPVPMGSKRLGMNRKTGRPLILDQKDGGLRSWQHAMGIAMDSAAKEYPVDQGGPPTYLYQRPIWPLGVPVALDLTFYLPRPKAHLRKNGELKPTAALFPTCKPDSSKVLRAAEDAGSGILWHDDAQIVYHQVIKLYAGHGNGPVRTEFRAYLAPAPMATGRPKPGGSLIEDAWMSKQS